MACEEVEGPGARAVHAWLNRVTRKVGVVDTCVPASGWPVDVKFAQYPIAG